MSYKGQISSVQVGQAGIMTDMSQALTPPFSPLEARNVTVRLGRVELEPGSRRWNATQSLPSPIVVFSDWWPQDLVQRMIIGCVNGTIYRFTNRLVPPTVISSSDGNAALMNWGPQPFMIAGGAEDLGRHRKLFILSGTNQIQVIEADGTTRRAISKPAADWDGNTAEDPSHVGNYPTAAALYNGRLWVWGCPKNPHILYGSSVDDQEDFQTPLSFVLVPVFPGEAQGIASCFVFKTKFFVTKFPRGLYTVDDTASDACFKISDGFGAASAHSAIQVVDDALIANSAGSITSLAATLNLGGVEEGDLLLQCGAQKYIRENVNPYGNASRWAIYDEYKKQAIFAFQSPSGNVNNRLLWIDYSGGVPRVTFTDKDFPTCLGLVKNQNYLDRPFYGGPDGYLIEMDQPDRNVGGAGYVGTFFMPHLDFGWLDDRLRERDKIFDFIGISYESRGNWNINCDIFVDEKFVKTVTFNLCGRGDHMTGDSKGFILSPSSGSPNQSSRLAGTGPLPPRLVPVDAMGKRIGLKFYGTGVPGQSFCFTNVQFLFRLAGQNNSST